MYIMSSRYTLSIYTNIFVNNSLKVGEKNIPSWGLSLPTVFNTWIQCPRLQHPSLCFPLALFALITHHSLSEVAARSTRDLVC